MVHHHTQDIWLRVDSTERLSTGHLSDIHEPLPGEGNPKLSGTASSTLVSQ